MLVHVSLKFIQRKNAFGYIRGIHPEASLEQAVKSLSVLPARKAQNTQFPEDLPVRRDRIAARTARKIGGKGGNCQVISIRRSAGERFDNLGQKRGCLVKFPG